MNRLQTARRTCKQHSLFRKVLSCSTGKVCLLTLIWYNQGELLQNSSQQLHHGFYVLSAEEEDNTSQVYSLEAITEKLERKRDISDLHYHMIVFNTITDHVTNLV